MTHPEFVLASRHIQTPAGPIDGRLIVVGGIVERILEGPGTSPPNLDVGAAFVLPGVVDTHVHVNDPGPTTGEGFQTMGAAAVAGGVTTVVDMPVYSTPVTTSVSALHAKAQAAEGSSLVDYGFWAGVIPGNGDQLKPLLQAGALGAKAFLPNSGSDDFLPVGDEDLRLAAESLADAGAPLLIHAELPGVLAEAHRPVDGGGATRYGAYLRTHPPEAEARAVELAATLAARYRCPIHIVHVSTADVWHALAQARELDVPLSAETCPHYLTFEAEAIPEGATEFKCTPPIRDAVNRQLLWNLLEGDLVTMVVSDHSPCPAGLKAFGRGDFLTAWGGIQSLQVSLSALWTEAAARGNDLGDVVRWMCEEPARLAGIDHRKGRIAPGFDADLVIFDPEAHWTVEPERLLHRHPHTPYAGRTLRGRVLSTFLRGQAVYTDGVVAGECRGTWLRREG